MTPVDVSKTATAQLLVQVKLLLWQLPLILWEGEQSWWAGFVLLEEPVVKPGLLGSCFGRIRGGTTHPFAGISQHVSIVQAVGVVVLYQFHQ